MFIGRTDAEAEAPILQYFGHLMQRADKSWLIRKGRYMLIYGKTNTIL